MLQSIDHKVKGVGLLGLLQKPCPVTFHSSFTEKQLIGHF
jgi:hypothetical protein